MRKRDVEEDGTSLLTYGVSNSASIDVSFV